MTGVVAATLTGPRRSPAVAARRDGASWVVDTPGGPVPVAVPRRRGTSDSASTRTPAPAPGEHTAEVLRELRIPVP